MPEREGPKPPKPYTAPQPDPEAGFVSLERDPIGFRNPLPYVLTHAVRFVASTLRFLRRHAWRLAALVFVVVAAEFVLQSVAPRYADRVYSDRMTGGHPIAMSPVGNRGSKPAVSKPEGTLRIIALGDSVTFGTGVAAEETWPIVMGELLGAELGRPVEVINTALPATDVAQLSLMLSSVWSEYEPDAAVVMLTGNMVSLAWIRQGEEVGLPRNPYITPSREPEGLRAMVARAKRLAQSLALPGFLAINVGRLSYWVGLNDHRLPPDAPFGALLAHGWRQPDLDPAVAARAWERVEEQLRELRGAHALPLCVSYAPSEFMVDSSFLRNLKAVPRDRISIDPSERAAEAARAAGLPFVPLKPALAAAVDGESLYVLDDYTHLSARGHRIAAEAMARCVAAELRGRMGVE